MVEKHAQTMLQLLHLVCVWENWRTGTDREYSSYSECGRDHRNEYSSHTDCGRNREFSSFTDCGIDREHSSLTDCGRDRRGEQILDCVEEYSEPPL